MFLDILSIEPKTLVFKEARYKTKIGLSFSLLSVVVTIILSCYFISQLLSKSAINILTNEVTTRSPVLNMTQVPFALSLYNTNGFPIMSESIAKISLSQVTIISKIGNNGQVQSEIKPLSLEKCNFDVHFKGYEDLFNNTKNGTDYLYCIKDGKENLYSSSIFGDVTNNLTYIGITVTDCVNSTLNNNTCLPQEKIDLILSYVEIILITVNYQINHTDLSNPLSPYLYTELFQMSNKMMKTYYSYYQTIDYFSDNGLVFEDNHYFHSFKHDITTVNVDTAELKVIGSILLTLNGNKQIIYRSFIKLQDVLANISGMGKLVFIIASVIVELLTEKLYYCSLTENILNNNKTANNDYYNESSNKTVKFTSNMLLQKRNNNSNNNNIFLNSVSIDNPQRILINNINNNNNSNNHIKNQKLV